MDPQEQSEPPVVEDPNNVLSDTENFAKIGCAAKRSMKAEQKATLIEEKFSKYHQNVLALADDWRFLT